MDDFATVSDLEKRYRVMDAQEMARASQLLHDASVLIATELKRVGVEFNEEDELQADNFKRVCCDMVRRALTRNTETEPNAYAYGGNLLGTASGDIYLTNAEKKSLGVGGTGRIGFASMI